MVPFTHPKPSGHNAHTRSDDTVHSRTSTLPVGHSLDEQGAHTVDAVRDHVTPSVHRTLDVVLHMKPASHGQHTPD